MTKLGVKKLKSQASLALVVALAAVMLSVSVLVSSISYNHYQDERSEIDATQSFLYTDTAMEDALLRLQRDVNYTGSVYNSSIGQVLISVSTIDSTHKQVTVTAQSLPVKRVIQATVSVTKEVNPVVNAVIFGGDDVKILRSNSLIVGDVYTTDNIDVDNSAIVQGNVYTAGQGFLTSSDIHNRGKIMDNPNTSGVVEGNIYSVDKIKVLGSGVVTGAAVSKSSVVVSGGSVGSSLVDPNLALPVINIPTFKYDTYKAQAQSEGTYYTSPSQFLNYLSLNGNTVSGGVHFIDSTSDLWLIDLSTYNITGTIISLGNIYILGQNYNQTAENNLPALVSKKNIFVIDLVPCNCAATINGVIFAEQSVYLQHVHYNGTNAFSITVTGGVWAGDFTYVQDYAKVIYDTNITKNVQGFNFSTVSLPPSTDNNVSVTSWGVVQ